jgi:hypothetical protein
MPALLIAGRVAVLAVEHNKPAAALADNRTIWGP